MFGVDHGGASYTRRRTGFSCHALLPFAVVKTPRPHSVRKMSAYDPHDASVARMHDDAAECFAILEAIS